MALINNAFTNDDDSDRSERLDALSTHIDDFAVELAYAGDRLTWAQGAYDAWQEARATAHVEDGEMDEAYQEFHKSVNEAYKYYTTARDMLTQVIIDHGGPYDDVMREYLFEGKSPQRFKDLVTAIETWKKAHERLKAKGDPRVLPDAIVDNLLTHRDTMNSLQREARNERDESRDAYEEKQDIFRTDSSELTFLFGLCKLAWGHDDGRLRTLGFVPSSEVWTENKPPHPKNFAYDDVAKQFNWDAVADVAQYEIDYRLTGASGDCAESQVDIGHHIYLDTRGMALSFGNS